MPPRSAPAQGFEDDDITSVVTGGSELSGIEQDLSGFGDGDSRRGSGLGTPLQRVTEETEMTAPLSPAQVALSKVGRGTSIQPSARMWHSAKMQEKQIRMQAGGFAGWQMRRAVKRRCKGRHSAAVERPTG